MNKQWMIVAAVAMLAFPPGLMAQKGGDASVSSPQAELGTAPRKSPFGAAAMSWFLPGAGSFYAGNKGHGFRHLGIAVGSTALVLATADDCNLFGESGPGCGVAVMSALVFVGNSIWSIFTAKNDAKDYNRSLETAGLQIGPQLVAVGTGGDEQLGLQLVSFGF